MAKENTLLLNLACIFREPHLMTIDFSCFILVISCDMKFEL